MLRCTVFILCMSSVSQAGALYINGVRVDGMANIKLRNVDIDIDAQGDIHVTAKGYQVNVGETARGADPQPAKPQPPPARNAAQPTKYYLTMAQNGDPQWDVDVFLNGTYVRRFSAGQTPPPIDVTKMIRPGDNSLRFHAVKQEGNIRSLQPGDLIQLTLDADQQLVTGRHELTRIYSYKRTAAETGMFDDSISVQTR
jgi:hypothetical protein